MIAACVLPRLATACVGLTTGDHQRVIGVVAVRSPSPSPSPSPSFAAAGQGTSPIRARAPTASVSPHARLVDASDAAWSRGVRPGQRVIDAQLCAPDLELVVVDVDELWRQTQQVAELLYRHAPVCEPLAPDERACLPFHAVVVDVTGLPSSSTRILSTLARAVVTAGHRPVIALSPSRALSLAVARERAIRPQQGRSLVVVDERAQARAGLGLDALELERDVVAALQATGVRTAADLVPLLQSGLVQRLGASARRVLPVLVDACDPADVDDGVVAWRPPERVSVERDLDDAVTGLEPLAFVLRPLGEQLLRRLDARGQKLLELALTLGLRGGGVELAIAFPSPTLDVAVVLRVLRVRLERAFAQELVIGEGVRHVGLRASRTTAARARQLEVPSTTSTTTTTSSSEAAHALIAELLAELGAERVGVLQATSAPLPEQMTTLAWPPRAPDPVTPQAPRRRRPRPVTTDPRTSSGRFGVGWPWPLSVLRQPVRLSRSDDVARETLFCRLEGDDARGPFVREYRVVVFGDGRRALCLYDGELDERFVCGWFD
jgi:protein ImuB